MSKARNGLFNRKDRHEISTLSCVPCGRLRSTDLIIDGNEVHHLKTGSSESLVVNGNVTNFRITHNVVHDNNNIGFDVIGFERTAPDPAVDQARDGVVSGNLVYNITSRGNPAYRNDESSDGIYVDGGTRILIEQNVIHDVDFGIELASEHKNGATSYITARNISFITATQRVFPLEAMRQNGGAPFIAW